MEGRVGEGIKMLERKSSTDCVRRENLEQAGKQGYVSIGEKL